MQSTPDTFTTAKSWIKLVSINDCESRFRIYRDWNGELIFDTNLKLSDCVDFILSQENWKNCICDFINVNIEIWTSYSGNPKCRLMPI